MSKAYLTIPPSELIKFKAWTEKLSQENQHQCQTIIRGTCFNIMMKAKRTAPVNFGFLRNSIGSSVLSGGMSAEVWAGGQGAGMWVKYAPYVEFGTGDLVSVPSDLTDYAIQFKGKGIRKVNNRARPYFFPAVKLGMKEMLIKLNQMGFK